MNEKTAALTAKWWRKKIENNHHDNGDKSSALAGLLADVIAAEHAPTVDKLDAFEEVLTKLMVDDKSYSITLQCDYHPCEMLSDAAKVVGINSSVFPWKVATYTTDTCVEAKDGYGYPFEPVNEFNFK